MLFSSLLNITMCILSIFIRLFFFCKYTTWRKRFQQSIRRISQHNHFAFVSTEQTIRATDWQVLLPDNHIDCAIMYVRLIVTMLKGSLARHIHFQIVAKKKKKGNKRLNLIEEMQRFPPNR